MNFDSLREVWQSGGGTPGTGPTAALADARRRAADLDVRVRRRDRRETVVAWIMIPVFLLFAVRAETALSAIGALMVVIACAFIPLHLRRARNVSASTAGLPVFDAVKVELQRVRAPERLLRSTLAWYFGPLGLGLFVYVGGMPGPVAGRGSTYQSSRCSTRGCSR